MSHIGRKYLSLRSVFCYSEGSSIIFLTSFRALKFKVHAYFRTTNFLGKFKIWINPFYKLYSDLYVLLRRQWGTTRKYIYYLLCGMYGFFKYKLQLLGLGYRFYIKSNFILLKLGYSHTLKVRVPLNIKVKKKKNLMILYSYNFFLLRWFSLFIRSLKKPGVYHGKGIKFKYEKIIKKEGKKSQF
jgi:hypothetical protein